MAHKIPKLSLTNLLQNDIHSIDLLSDALTNHGFFVITDHGIPFTLFNKAYEYSEKFFNLLRLSSFASWGGFISFFK